MDVYEKLLSRFLYPAWEVGLRRRKRYHILRHLEQTQWESREALLSRQSGALARLIAHVYANVPHYRDAMRSRGLQPRDIGCRASLSKLPILDRATAAASSNTRTSRGGPALAVRKKTSGTMGMPLQFAYDQNSDEWRHAIRLRSYGWLGYPIGVRSLHYWAAPPCPLPWKRRLKVTADRTLKRELYLDCTPRDRRSLDQAVAAIRRHRPSVIVTFSQAGAALARHINRTNARNWSDIAVICGAERLHEADRNAMHEAFGAGIFETYGSREIMLMACECPAHSGLHEMSENVIVEIVIRNNGIERPAAPGEVGEVVVTDLHNFGMPFIRYANGDRARHAGSATCSCGRSMPLISAIEGRVAETLYNADGEEVSGLIFNLVFVEIADVTEQFQVIQHANRAITLKIVPAHGFDPSHITKVRDQATRYLSGVPVKVEIVEHIPLSAAGKQHVVVVEEQHG